MSNTRITLVVELLRLHADPLAFGAALEGVRGSGSAVPMRPHERHCRLVTGLGPCTCWLRSDDELGRVLERERVEERELWLAVRERYLNASRHPMLVLVRRGVPQVDLRRQEVLSLVNKLDLSHRGDGVTRVMVESWRPVDPAALVEGVDWLSNEFQGPLQLPDLTREHRGRPAVAI